MFVEILIFILTFLLSYYIYVWQKIHKFFESNCVKYVKGVPVFGNVMKSTLMRRHLAEDAEEVYMAYPDERYVGFIEFMRPTIMVRDPELIKQITVKDFDHFVDHKDFFSDFAPLMKASILSMTGDKWRDMRMTLSPAFTGSKMRQMMPFMMETSDNIVEYLKEHVNEDINVGDLIRRYTNDVIASAVFGLKINSLKDKDNRFYTTAQRLFNFTAKQKMSMVLAILFPSLSKKFGLQIFPEDVVDFFRTIVSDTISYRESNNVDRPDMIQLLMEASKGKLKQDNKQEFQDVGFATVNEELKSQDVLRKWSLDELAGQVFIFFIAGFETSAGALVMCIHELALNQGVQEKLFREVREFTDGNQKVDYENIANLKYLDCVLNETLRKWSPASIMDRICTKPYQFPPPSPNGKPYQVNPGDLVYYSVSPVHLDPKYWPEPRVFRPERFSDENKHNIRPFTFMPFGVGPRNCIGSRFALMELKILLFKLILNFKILKCEKTSDPLELKPELFNIVAAGGTWIRMCPRT
ncbi:probable cytochrome P450 9f2 [Amyelois transitella]|uniref:probable cytochrome P450 9f2 n=1 Tax=Amyelois transitella TaxID=680683 RepID=UPI00298FFB85|nr:probable cytochrome P450 9f2 [Amyelois transitella]